MKLTAIKAGVKKSSIGAWVRDIPVDGMESLALKVRGHRNIEAQRIRGEMIAVLSEAERKDMPEDKGDEIVITVLSEAVLVDWNLTDDDDRPIPCTPAKAREIMSDPEVGPAFRGAVAWAAAVVVGRGVESIEADVKN